MFKVIGIFTLMCAMCRANVPVAPPAPPQVSCGYIPKELYSCAHLPVLIPHAAANKCQLNLDTTCKKMTCIFRESGWIDGATVNKVKLTEHLDRFLTDHKDWSAAIQQAKANCLANLPAQGYDINCPAYDVTHCFLVQFIKNVPAALWSTSPNCASVRQFAESCPVCPDDCFSQAIPIGSCNACYSLPRSP